MEEFKASSIINGKKDIIKISTIVKQYNWKEKMVEYIVVIIISIRYWFVRLR
jgi:hypothetical protein